ncbi:MAG TPA: Fic family protein [Alphaproteobacteria bacterium]|nr:Fic family protein [Alphaproteobacteria bacterium]
MNDQENSPSNEGKDILSLISNYSKTWNLLSKFEEGKLVLPKDSAPSTETLGYKESIEAMGGLKKYLIDKGEATSHFGIHPKQKLEGILGNIEQTFGESQLYASAEEKAAHLLYFLIKDHPFSDGNESISVLLFLIYLKKQGISLAPFSDMTLVALALLIAGSDPYDKDLIIRLIVNMIVL